MELGLGGLEIVRGGVKVRVRVRVRVRVKVSGGIRKKGLGRVNMCKS